MDKKRLVAYAAILTNVVIWGAALPVVKTGLNTATPYQFLLVRYVIACVILIPTLWFTWPKNLTLKTLLSITGIEAVQVGLSLSLLYQGLANTSALTAAFIGSTAPIFVILGGIFLLKEKEEKREWLGLLFSITGTAIIIIGSVASTASGNSSAMGIFFLGLYLLADMAYLLLAKKHYRTTNKLFITAISSIVGLVIAAFTANLFPHPPLAQVLLDPGFISAAMYMGILGTPIAVSALLYGQSKIEASETALFTYLQPLVYIPLGVLWLKESITVPQIIGLLLIFCGVILAEFRTKFTRSKFLSS